MATIQELMHARMRANWLETRIFVYRRAIDRFTKEQGTQEGPAGELKMAEFLEYEELMKDHQAELATIKHLSDRGDRLFNWAWARKVHGHSCLWYRLKDLLERVDRHEPVE